MPYKGFISYSHDADSIYAPKLQNGLHQFAKPFNRLRALHIFRDQTDLSANPALWPVIRNALDDSEYFLLLASPEAAKSKWVKMELDHWITTHRGSVDKLLIILTKGKLVWDAKVNDFNWKKTTALPKGLDWPDNPDPNPNTMEGRFKLEPFYLDQRWVRTETDLSLRNPRFLDEIATLASTLHGKRKSEMIGADVKAHTRYRRVRTAVIGALFIFAVVAGSFGLYATQQKSNAESALQLAEDRRVVAENEKSVAEEQRNIAQKERKTADEQRLIAENKTEEAKKAALAEEAAKNTAEERRKEAEKQTEIANERRKEAEVATEKEKVATRHAEAQLTRSEHLLYASTMKYADSLYQKGDFITFRAILDYVKQSSLSNGFYKDVDNTGLIAGLFQEDVKKTVLPGFEWNFLNHHSESLIDTGSAETPLVFSPSGDILISTSKDDAVGLTGLNLKTGDNFDLPQSVNDEPENRLIKFSPAGKWLLSVRESDIQIWNTNDWKERTISFSPFDSGPDLNSYIAENHEFLNFISENEIQLVSSYGEKKDYVIRRLNLISGEEIAPPGKIKFERAFSILAMPDHGKQAYISYSEKIGEKELYHFSVLELARDGKGKNNEVAIETSSWGTISVSKDGKFFAKSTIEDDARCALAIWDAQVRKKIGEITCEQVKNLLVPIKFDFSYDNKWLAWSTTIGTGIWNIDSDKIRFIPLDPSMVGYDLAFSPDNRHLAVGGAVRSDSKREVKIIDFTSREDVTDFNGEEFLALSQDSKKALTMDKDLDLSIWDFDKKHGVGKLPQSYSGRSAQFSPDGNYVYLNAGRERLGLSYLWDSRNFRKVDLAESERCRPYYDDKIAFSPDGGMFAQTCRLESGDNVVVWDLRTGERIIGFRRDDIGSQADPLPRAPEVEFTEDGKHLVIFRKGNEVKFLEVRNIGDGTKLALPGLVDETHIDFIPKGNWLLYDQKGKFFLRKLASTPAESIFLWDGGEKSYFVIPPHILMSGPSQLMFVSYDKVLHTIDLKTKTRSDFPLGSEYPHATFLSSSAKLLIGVGYDPGTIYVWNLKTREKKTIPVGSLLQKVISCTLSADENRFVTVHDDGAVKFWDLIGGQEVLSIDTGQTDLTKAILTDDNTRLITITRNSVTGNRIKSWHTSSKQALSERR